MKKYLLLLVVGLLLVTGCGNGNEVVCTIKKTENGVTTSAELIAKLEEDKVVDADIKMTFDNEEMAQAFCAILRLATTTEDGGQSIKLKCKTKTLVMKNLKNLSSDTIDVDTTVFGFTKEEFINAMEEEGYSCK